MYDIGPVASPNGSVEPNSKRQRVNGESETVKQSSWNKNEFNCVHVKEWKKQEHADVTVFSDHSLFKSFLNYMVENRSLKVEVWCLTKMSHVGNSGHFQRK